MFKLKQSQQGLAAVEMTLVLPILLLFFFATAEFGRLLYQYNALTKAARDAARYYASNHDGASSEVDTRRILIYGHLNDSTTEILPNLAAATFDVDDDGKFVTVTVSYPWQPIWGDSLPSFVSDTSFDLSFDLVSTYTLRVL